MFGLKKTAIAWIAFSNIAFAGTLGPVCDLGDVTTPCDVTAWNFGMSALYLKTIADADFNYVNTAVTPTGALLYRNHPNDWHWGFKLEGSYHWGPGSDINVSWYHIKSDADSREFGPISLPNQLIVEGGISEHDFHWDAVNGEWGQVLLLGCDFWRFHGGFQVASIKTEETRFFPGVLPLVLDWEEFIHSEFSGFGPRGGVEYTHRFSGVLGGVGVYFKSAAALLVGNSKFDNQSTRLISLAGIPWISGSKKAMVPELEAKLGLSYEYPLAQADLVFDVGYMCFNYFNAQHNLNVSEVSGLEADFAASGLYFGFVYKGFV